MVDWCARSSFARVVYLMVDLLEDVEGVEVEFAGVVARALSRGLRRCTRYRGHSVVGEWLDGGVLGLVGGPSVEEAVKTALMIVGQINGSEVPVKLKL